DARRTDAEAQFRRGKRLEAVAADLHEEPTVEPEDFGVRARNLHERLANELDGEGVRSERVFAGEVRAPGTEVGQGEGFVFLVIGRVDLQGAGRVEEQAERFEHREIRLQRHHAPELRLVEQTV